MYTANFADDRDIAEPAVVSLLLESVGQSPALLTAAQSAAAKAKLRTQTERAMTRGIFGAPSFLVGEELFWGNDRLEPALAWATR